MRRCILLALLVASIIGTAPLAQAQLFKKKESATVSQTRAILKSLTPTEAEAKAIANLSDKSALAGEIESNPNEARISFGCRFISVEESLAKMIVDEPAMSWSECSQETPMQVRFLEEVNVQKFINLILSDRKSSVLETPRITVPFGEEGLLEDTTTLSFVTSVCPIVGDDIVAYQPVITDCKQGMIFKFKATLLEDGSCRLDACQLETSRILKVSEFTFAADEITETKKGALKKITVQQPEIATFSVTTPEIVVPEGMSVLVAFQGIQTIGQEKGESPKTFMLLSPKVLKP